MTNIHQVLRFHHRLCYGHKYSPWDKFHRHHEKIQYIRPNIRKVHRATKQYRFPIRGLSWTKITSWTVHVKDRQGGPTRKFQKPLIPARL